jgi:SAM-dependent methyltransferase
MTQQTPPAALIDAASEFYRQSGRFAYYFARNKLRHDPVFTQILALGLLSNRARILDLGCGQGLLVAWLTAAVGLAVRQTWPSDWPAVPRPQSIRGIELQDADLARARRALTEHAEFISGDIRSANFGAADAVVIVDVLHYIDHSSQLQVLQRVHHALVSGGVLLLRVGDADGGWRFRLSVWVDQAAMLVRGHGMRRLHTRSLRLWRQILDQCGFSSDSLPMSAGTLFANILLVARPK